MYAYLLLSMAQALYSIPQYDAGGPDTSCTPNSNSPWSQTKSISFTYSFTVTPQVVISQNLIDGHTSAPNTPPLSVGYATELQSVTKTGFSFNCKVLLGYMTEIFIYWFAFVDDNVFSIQGVTTSVPASITIKFPTALSYTPNLVFFVNGITIVQQTGLGIQLGYLLTMNPPTSTDVTINITPLSGYVINYLSYSILYGDPNRLLTGQQTSTSQVAFQFFTPQIYYPVFGIGVLSVDTQNDIRIREPNTRAQVATGNVKIETWYGTTMNSYNVAYYQYSPCPSYCTKCQTAYPNCDACILSSLRLIGTNCVTCQPNYYALSSQMNCLSCISYCNGCAGTAYSCTACGSATNRIIGTLCTTCPITMYIQAGNDNCQVCNTYCNGCLNTADQCLTCQTTSLRTNAPNCTTCPLSKFLQAGTDMCQSCVGYCYCSVSATNCTSCITSTQRLQPPNCQTCPNNMFGQAGQNNCQQCNTLCNQCTISSNNCTACNGLYRTNAPNCDQCSQVNYYVDMLFNDCQPCASYCNGCINTASNCLACWPFTLNQISPNCIDCPQTQYSLSSNQCNTNIVSLICTSAYNRDLNCNCLPGFYNTPNSLTCSQCAANCQSCSLSATNCTVCNSKLQVSPPPTCINCIDGLFMLYGSCAQCQSSCKACTQSSNNCLTCTSPRINPPICSCPNGYFNNCSQTCSFQCSSCSTSANECLACAGNRINPPVCGCPDGTIQTSTICSSCSIAEPKAQFSDDLNTINVAFQFQLNSNNNCNTVISQQTLITLGSSCQCSVNLNTLIITLGTNATISIYQPIFINSNQLQFKTCNTSISNIITPLVGMPQNLLVPKISFNSEIFTTTPCDDVVISIIQSTNSGQRNPKLIGWSVRQANNSMQLSTLIDTWNQNTLKNSYVINSKYLQNQGAIVLMISYSNFLGTINNQSIQIFVQSQNLQIQVLVPNEIYVFDTAQIMLTPQLLQCGGNFDVNSKIDISVSISNQTTNLNYNYTLVSDSQAIISFDPYQLRLGSTYQVMAIAIYNKLSTQLLKQFTVTPFNFTVQIDGGDQSIGIKQIMNLTMQIFDPNNQVANLSQFNLTWFCNDIVTNQPCSGFTYNQQIAKLNTTNYQPFQTLHISAQAITSISQSSNNITINIFENQINQITINGNQYQLNSQINTYEQVDISIEYQSQVNYDIDQLTYYASYIDSTYQLNLVQFYFFQTTMNMNNFVKFQTSSNVKFKVIISNPIQSQPSTATVNIILNIPPQQCQIRISPRQSKYNLQIDSCISKQQPLQYQFILYSSKSDLIIDNQVSIITKGIPLNDFQSLSSLITYLMGTNESLILGLIKDNSNGLSNVSISLKGLQFIDSTLFKQMLQDNPNNLPRNLLFMLSYANINNQSISTTYTDKINLLLSALNQSNSLIQSTQQSMSTQQTLSNTQIQTQMSVTSVYITNIGDQISALQQRQSQGEYIKDYQIQLQQLFAKLSASANHVSFLYSQSQQNQNRRLLQEQSQNITQFILQSVSNITNIVAKLIKTNQESKAINTSEFNLSAQKFSTNSVNQNFGLQVINQSNQTVSYKNQQFQINPHQNESNFKNPVKAPLIIPNLTDVNSVQIKPANPIPLTFPLIGDLDIQCASQIEGSWSVDVCQVVKSTTIKCLCQTLSPLSIVQALEFILGQFALLFEHQIVQKINVFHYEQTCFTYVVGVFLVIYFYAKFILHNKDSQDSCQVHPLNEQPQNFVSMPDQDNVQQGKETTTKIAISQKHIVTSENFYTSDSLLGLVQSGLLSKSQGYLKFLQNSHVVFEIYYRFDAQDPRLLRLNILFLQILGQICIFALFGKNLAISIVIGLSIFQTAYGLVFQLILSKMIKSKNGYLKTAGVIIAALLTGFSTYLIIASIALYPSAYQANIAALTYLASFVVDYFLTNILVELGKYIFLLKTCNSNQYQKIYDALFTKGLQIVVFGKTLNQPKTSREI